MDIADYIEYVASEGDKFAAAAHKGSLEADVAACDDWNMRALVRHIGLIHLWAAAHVAFSSDNWLDSSDDIPALSRYWPDLAASWPADTELVAWYRRTKEPGPRPPVDARRPPVHDIPSGPDSAHHVVAAPGQ